MTETQSGSHEPGDQEPPTEPREWTVQGFLNEFMRIDETMKDRSFAFILGAGASISSKIPGAWKLAHDWVEDLYGFYADKAAAPAFEAWATPENVGIPGFNLDRAATFYSQVYDKRFGDDLESGYAYLEDAMKVAEPNIGYSILAKVLENTRHKVVITTNFDNLVADALSIYTDTFPLVCGHESLTSFVRSRLRRPLIAKVHRDLLLAPRSSTGGTSRLDERWARVLQNLLRDYTPIVIGYGGNDGSLMDFLDALRPGDIQGGIYWCYHQTSGKPDQRIRHLVAKHRGKLIPIVGFDEFMIQLGQRLKYRTLADEIDQRAQKRVKAYREQWEQCQKRLAQPASDSVAEEAVKPIREALAATVEREDSWWSWELKARAEPDPDKAEAVYRQGLQQFPASAELVCNFAVFLHETRKKFDEAEPFYRRAMELDPKDGDYPSNLAIFMENVRKNHDEAERLYRRALELDPTSAKKTGNFAHFMANVGKNYDEAERLYRRALELDPNDGANICNFAAFMWNVRKNYDEAERLYRRALELDPNNARKTANFAGFVADARKNYDEAERLYRHALELEPANGVVISQFAVFMTDPRKKQHEAEDLFRRALELDPNNADAMSSFAVFLFIQKRLAEAKQQIRKALSLDRYQPCATLVCWCLIAQAEKHDDTPGLARLKFVLGRGLPPGPWYFAEELRAAAEMIPAGEMPFYTAITDAIADSAKMKELERFDRWKQITPIPPDEPWSTEQLS